VDKPHNLYLSRSITQKLVLGSFDNINFKIFFFSHRRNNEKLSFSNYLSLDIPHGAYSFGDSIFHWIWPLIHPVRLAFFLLRSAQCLETDTFPCHIHQWYTVISIYYVTLIFSTPLQFSLWSVYVSEEEQNFIW